VRGHGGERTLESKAGGRTSGAPATIGRLSLTAGRRGTFVVITGRTFGNARADGAVHFGDAASSTYPLWSDTMIVAAVRDECGHRAA
jgi:hypothetical protein